MTSLYTALIASGDLINADSYGENTYAIVSDVGPTRCNIDRVVKADTGLDAANIANVGLHRVMRIPNGAVGSVRAGDRAWHANDEIEGSGRG